MFSIPCCCLHPSEVCLLPVLCCVKFCIVSMVNCAGACVCVCVCVRVCMYMYVLGIVSVDKVLHSMNTLIIIIIVSLAVFRLPR